MCFGSNLLLSSVTMFLVALSGPYPLTVFARMEIL